MFRVVISPKAKSELKGLTKIYKKAIAEAIESIAESPYAGKPLTRELTGMYSYRIGVYRIIYKISKQDKKIQIITAGHRATAYKLLQL